MLNFPRTQCEVCGCDAAKTAVIVDPSWPLSQCGSCGFVFLSEAPDYAAVATEYAWEKTSLAESAKRQQHLFGRLERATRWRTRLGHLADWARRKRTLGTTGNVLDIGCSGSCRVPVGPTPFGIEISGPLAVSAQKSFGARGGLVVHAPAIDGIDRFADGFFSAILMRSYLEHEKSAFEVLRKSSRKLKPGGKIYVRVPDFASINRRVMGSKWCGYRFPDHVNYFTGATLKRLAYRSGLTYRRVNKLSMFDDNIIAELRKPG